MISFLDLTMPQRINYVSKTKDNNFVYELISKHLYKDLSCIKSSYSVVVDRQRISLTITGNPEDIYNLFTELYKFGLEFESITQTSLRIDTYKFINTIK